MLRRCIVTATAAALALANGASDMELAISRTNEAMENLT